MKIRCEKCGVEHELDPPAWVVETGRPFRFRCASCGHSHLVDLKAATPAPPPSPPPEPVVSDDVYLKQEGKVYLVKTWENLGKWIEEGRVGASDLVSEGGVRWEPVSSRREFDGLFAAPAPEPEPEAPSAGIPSLGLETPFATQQLGTETPFGPSSAQSSFDPSDMPFPAGPDVVERREPTGEGEQIYPPAMLDETPVPPPPLSGPSPSAPRIPTPRPVEPTPVPLKLSEVPTLTRERFSEIRDLPTGDQEIEGLTAERVPPALGNSLPDAEADAFFDSYNTELDGNPDLEFDSAEWKPSARPNMGLILGGSIVALLGLAVVAWVWTERASEVEPESARVSELHIDHPSPDPAPPVEPAEPEPSTVEPAAPAPVEPEPVAPEPTEPAPVAPAPAEPAPMPPQPAAPRPVSVSSLVDRGWAQVDSGNLSAAESTFGKALARSAGHSGANYGYAYVLMEGGDTGPAQTHACRAQQGAGSDVELKREIASLLKRLEATCD